VSPKSSAAAPGDEVSVALEVTDIDGNPVPNATVSLVAVDEAILALSGYTLRDPLLAFYPAQPANIRDYYLQDHLILATLGDLSATASSDDMAVEESAQMNVARSSPEAELRVNPPAAMKKQAKFATASADSAGAQAEPQPIAARKDFSPL